MFKSLGSKIVFVILFFFAFHLVWLYRAYADVAWMDQIQFLTGNVKHFYEANLTVQDFYYRPPFLFFFSNLFVFINCELFAYNTYLENIFSGIFLLLIAFYFVRSNIEYFNGKAKLYFALLASFIVFGLQKWELTLWSGGWSHIMVVFLVYVCIDLAHNFYLNRIRGIFFKKYFIPVYVLVSLVAILECTAYFLPFQVTFPLLLLINYKLFHGAIDVKKWRTVFLISIVLLVLGLWVNNLAETYSVNNPYDGYSKVNISQNIGESVDKLFTDPGFVVNFYLLANTGNLIDNESYNASQSWKGIMPYIGVLILLAYAYAIYLFIRNRKLEYLFSINLILYTMAYYGIVLIGRMRFNDVFYGTSSRYTAATFAGILGMITIYLLVVDQKKYGNIFIRLLYSVPIVMVCIGYLATNYNQWKLAPYRKANYRQMAINLKENKDLEMLQGNSVESTQKARQVMIKNGLNVFKPETELSEYTIKTELSDVKAIGFYEVEQSEKGSHRWTNGASTIYLPNLYTDKDSVKVTLICYVPYPDTPKVVLNDDILPSSFRSIERGLEYTFPVKEQKVIFKASIINKSFVPNELDQNNADVRSLGLLFNSLTLQD